MLHPFRALRVRTLVWLAVLVALPALLPGTATAQDAASAPGLGPRLLADASWHGRTIQRPLARRSDVSDATPSLRPGTGYTRPGGSRRVRDLQRRLTRLGYRPGARDGLFGPRTQAAVLAFQRKHGLRRTGTVAADTLRVLQRRTARGATSDPSLQTQSRAAAPTAPAPSAVRITPASSDGDGLPALAVLLILAVCLPLLALASVAVRRRTAPAPVVADGGPAEVLRPEPEPQPEPEPEPEPDPEPIRPPDDEIPRVRKVAPAHGHRHYGPPRDRRIALRERILRMRAEGMSLQEIADTLTAEGEVTLGGGTHWQPWSVRAATRPTSPGDRSGGRLRQS
jgi:putative peptidoglycan binding protein